MKFKVGLAQIYPCLGDVERNLKLYEAQVAQAVEQEVSLIVFPELSLTGYTLKDMVPVVAQRFDEPAFRRLLHLSQDIAIVVGFIEESSGYEFYNSAAFLYQGEILHVHRKVYLPTYGMFDEQRYMAVGDRVRAFDTPWGRMAMLICEDMWHLSAPYIAAMDGAQFLIAVSSSPARGMEGGDTLYGTKSWEQLNRVYAQSFSQYVVFVNRVGYEDGIGFWGGSEVLDPEAHNLAKASYFEQDFCVAELDTERIRRSRIFSPLLRDERLGLTLRELQRIGHKRYE